MNEDGLLMNDTLDNFTFSDVKSQNIIDTKTLPEEISFDDSSFLNTISLNWENTEKNNQIQAFNIKQNVLGKNDNNSELSKKGSYTAVNTDKIKPNYSPKRAVVSDKSLYTRPSTRPLRKPKENETYKPPENSPITVTLCTEEKGRSKQGNKQGNKKKSENHEILQNLEQQQVTNNSLYSEPTNALKNVIQRCDKNKHSCDEETNIKISNSVSNETNNLYSWGLPEAVLDKYKSKKIDKMFPWQVECLSNPRVLNELSNLIYSAPTSAGKTLVAEILALKTIFERNKKVIFILPFVSIVREKMYYFQDLLGSSGIRAEGFMGSYNPPGGFGSIHLAICTIEKANSLINKLLEEGRLSEIGAVLVDEMHLLGDPHRGYLLELLLTKLNYISLKEENIKIQIIGMSATLPNLDQLAKWLGAELYSTSFRPIPLHEQAIVCGDIYDKNLKLLRKLQPLPGVAVDTDCILQLCLETIKDSCSVLIFCPYKNWCENLSQQISAAFLKIGNSQTDQGELLRLQIKSDLILEVLEQLKCCPVGLDQVLRKTVSFGVAFHHAGLTMDERDIIEGAFRNGAVRILVATSTLSSGVNLPARRVIVRSPTFSGKPIDLLTYRQMIGRAGRMGKDTVGESYLVCQKNEFKIAEELMSAELPAVESCLEGGGKLKRAILEVIASGVALSPNDVTLFTKCTLLAVTELEKDNFEDPISEAVNFLKNNEFIRLQILENGTNQYIATSLGKACLSSSIAPDEGLALFTELEKARQCIVLETELHLIYLVTPYNACYSWGNIDWMFYLDLWDNLSVAMKRVGELVGVRESYIVNATRGKLVLDANNTKLHQRLMVHKRFFVALALQDLVNEVPLGDVCVKFNCNRGMLQSLQQAASSFAGMVSSFSRQLGWSSVEILLSQFQDRMQFGVSRDLLDLMHLPSLNGKLARIIYNAGLESVIQLANSDVNTVENILYKAGPFERLKEREGESEFEYKQRNKLRTVWVTGKEGLTEREAAQLLIKEARTYLKIEMGLKNAEWDNQKSEVMVKSLDRQISGSLSNKDISGNVLYKHDSETLKENEVNLKNNSFVRSKDNLPNQNDSANSSMSSLTLNISLENHFNIDLKDEPLGECNIQADSSEKEPYKSPENRSPENSLSNESLPQMSNNQDCYELNISASSSMFSDISFTRLEENIQINTNESDKKQNLDNKKHNKCCELSNVLRSNSPMELNISDSSVFSLLENNSVNKSKSEQSVIEASSSLHTSDESTNIKNSCSQTIDDFETEGFFEKAVMDLKFSQDNEDKENITFNLVKNSNSSRASDILPLPINKCSNKRSRNSRNSSMNTSSDNSFLDATPTKKSRVLKAFNTPLESAIKRVSLLSLEDNASKTETTDNSKINIICVSNEDALRETFYDELMSKKDFSFSIACSRVIERKPTIGANILNANNHVDLSKQEKITFKGKKVEGFAFCWGNTDAYFVSTNNPETSKSTIKILKKVFTDEKITVRIFSAKETIKTLKLCCGIDFLCILDDPKVADWLLDADIKEKSLQAMVSTYCRHLTDISKLCGKITDVSSIGLDINSSVEPKIRASVESILTWHLMKALNEKLKQKIPKIKIASNRSFPTTYGLEMRTILCLANMEIYGMSANKSSLQNLVDVLKSHQSSLEKKAFSLAGRRFNFSSSADVAKVTGMYKGKKVSTRKQVLEQNSHPISDLVLQWRKINFTLTKMVYPLIRSCENGRIFGSYDTYTATGRISMHEPNIQMITKDFNVIDPITRKNVLLSCRSAFGAPEGYVLVSADYCQLELRILTYLSGDKLLKSVMKKPGDIFKYIAAKWNNVTEDMVDGSMRQHAKQLCYGIIYGMGAKTLAEQLEISEDDAVNFMESFKNTYSGIKTFIKNTVDSCRQKEFVETITGRRRYLPHINHPDSFLKSQAERQAVNTTVQGSAADIVKNAMIVIEDKINIVFKKSRYKPKLTLHLHDELIYEVPEKYLEKSVKIIRKGMENSAVGFGHFPVKVKTGKSWGELTEFCL